MKRVNKDVMGLQVVSQSLGQQWRMVSNSWGKTVVLLLVSTFLGWSGVLEAVSDRLWSPGLTESQGEAWAQELKPQRSRNGWVEGLLSGGNDDIAGDSVRISRSWSQVFERFGRFLGGDRDDVADDPGRTSRGDVCLVSPNSPTPSDPSESASSVIAQVWHPQPTFVWTGRAEAIALRVVGSQDAITEQTVLGRWSATYDESPLEFGQTYEWVVEPATPSGGLQVASFVMVSVDDYEQIGMELEAIQASLADSEPTAEALVLARAEYFAQQHLWADMWREVLAVEDPSDELMRSILEALERPCILSESE